MKNLLFCFLQATLKRNPVHEPAQLCFLPFFVCFSQACHLVLLGLNHSTGILFFQILKSCISFTLTFPQTFHNVVNFCAFCLPRNYSFLLFYPFSSRQALLCSPVLTSIRAPANAAPSTTPSPSCPRERDQAWLGVVLAAFALLSIEVHLFCFFLCVFQWSSYSNACCDCSSSTSMSSSVVECFVFVHG